MVRHERCVLRLHPRMNGARAYLLLDADKPGESILISSAHLLRREPALTEEQWWSEQLDDMRHENNRLRLENRRLRKELAKAMGQRDEIAKYATRESRRRTTE